MFLSKRKKSYCQNCSYPLTSNYNFCPECGQENTDKLVSFQTLIGDFFSNYFSYDSRLARTITPFLFKPGKLTKEFIAGKRATYMHPLRLYLIISFFYFLMFSLSYSHDHEDMKLLNFTNGPGVQATDSLSSSPNLTRDNEAMNESKKSVKVDLAKRKVDKAFELELKVASADDGVQFDDLKILNKEGVTTDEVLRTLKQEPTTFNTILTKQAIKLANERQGNVLRYLIKNASIMMFVLLPFFALLLKLVYVRRNKLYIEHITFTLHLHSFMFIILFFALVINYFLPEAPVIPIGIFVIFIYFLLAIKNVYNQSWFKSFAKLILLSWGYGISFLLFLISTITISFFLY